MRSASDPPHAGDQESEASWCRERAGDTNGLRRGSEARVLCDAQPTIRTRVRVRRRTRRRRSDRATNRIRRVPARIVVTAAMRAEAKAYACNGLEDSVSCRGLQYKSTALLIDQEPGDRSARKVRAEEARLRKGEEDRWLRSASWGMFLQKMIAGLGVPPWGRAHLRDRPNSHAPAGFPMTTMRGREIARRQDEPQST